MTAARRILRAELGAAGGPLALLGVLAALAAALLVAAPPLVAHATSLELAAVLQQLPDDRRDPSGNVRGATVLGSPDSASTAQDAGDAVFGGVVAALAEHTAAQPEPLRSALGTAELVVVGEPVVVAPAVPRDDDPRFLVRAIVAPDLPERVAVVAGRLPEPVSAGAPVELVLTAPGSEALRWAIGEQRAAEGDGPGVVLVGIVQQVDPAAGFWTAVPAAPASERFDDGNQQPRETAAAFLHPSGIDAVARSATLSVRIPFDVAAVDAESVGMLLPQLRALVGSEVPLPSELDGGPSTVPLVLGSTVPAAADAVLARGASTAAIAAAGAAGPLSALVIVLAVTAQSVVERWRPVLALRLVRGQSRAGLRWRVAATVSLVMVPAALGGVAAGAAAGALATGAGLPTGPGLAGALAGLGLAVIPAAVAAGRVPRARDTREHRDDLGRPGPVVVAAELALLVTAGLAVVAVVASAAVPGAGGSSGPAPTGASPLLVTMPVLLALAAAVIALRVLPLLATGVSTLAARGGSAVAVLGARSAARDRRAATPALVIALLTTAATVTSLSLLTVLDRGVDRVALDELGAGIRASGPGVGEGLAVELRGLDELAVVGTVDVVGSVVVLDDGVREIATLIMIDADAASLRADAPPALVAGTAAAGGTPVTVIVSDDLLPASVGAPEPGARLSVDGVEVEIAAVSRSGAGYGAAGSWVVVGAADATRFTDRPSVDLLLAEPEPGVPPAQAAAVIDRVSADRAAGEVRIALASERADAQRAAPLTALVRGVLIGGAALTIVLAVIALAAIAVAGRPARQRLQTLARVLGLRRATALTLWQLLPPVIVGTVTGGAVGVASALLTLLAVDLSGLAGSSDPLPTAPDPAVVLATAGAALLAMGVVVAVAAAVDRRTALLTALRTESA